MSNTVEKRQEEMELRWKLEHERGVKEFKDKLDELINNGEDLFVKQMGLFIKQHFGGNNLCGDTGGSSVFFSKEDFYKIIELHRGNVKEVK